MTQQPHSEHTALSRFYRQHADSECEGFHASQPSGSPAPAGGLRLNFDVNRLESVQTPQMKGSIPQDCPHTRRHCFSTHYGAGAPVIPPQAQYLLEQPTELRKTVCLLFPVYY